MKKQILFVLASFLFMAVSAQTEKGNRLIGVNFGGISYTNSDNNTSYSNTPTQYNSTSNGFSIYVNPSVAWFVKDNLAVGGSVSINFYTSKSNNSNTGSTSTSDSKYSSPSFSIGPYARYYFKGSDKAKPFVQVNAGLGISPSKNTYTSSTPASNAVSTTKSKGNYNAGATFGYEQFITKTIGLAFTLGVNYSSNKSTTDYKPSTGTGYSYTSTYKYWSVPFGVALQIHLPKNAK